ncbi:MAG: hypothetical protein WA432_04660 [Candidatus Babeliaceae bacterium]
MKKYVLFAVLAFCITAKAGERLDACPEVKEWLTQQVEACVDKEVILAQALIQLRDHVTKGLIIEDEVQMLMEEVEEYIK